MKKILIVEDDKDLSAVLVSKLEKSGYEVHVAYDGVEGLEKVKGTMPDLVLLDVIMPKLDGMSVLDKIKSNPLTSSIPVIVLTNLSDSEKILFSKKRGATDYLVKSDWSLGDLVKKIEQTLQ